MTSERIDLDDWARWKNKVLATAERQERKIEVMDEKIHLLELELKVFETEIKIKASIWGGFAGAVPTLVATLYYLGVR